MSAAIPDWLKGVIPKGEIASLGRNCIRITGERDYRVKFSDTLMGGQILQRESLWLNRIRNTGVSTHQCLDLVKDAKNTVLTTDYIKGLSASQWLKQHSSSDNYVLESTHTHLARYTESLVASLENLHRANIVHGDIKPGNVLFSDNGICYLIDFSNARRVGEPWNERGLTQFTLSYCHPNLVSGAKKEHDYYSVLVTLAVLFGESVEVRTQIERVIDGLLDRLCALDVSDEIMSRLEYYASSVRRDLALITSCATDSK